MKQTAVEWLQEQLKDVKYNPLETNGYSNSLERIYDQAKEMEKQQQGYNYKKVCEIERFRAIDFAKWFADFNGLTWEEKRVSKEHLDNLYEQYLKTLGGGI